MQILDILLILFLYTSFVVWILEGSQRNFSMHNFTPNKQLSNMHSTDANVLNLVLSEFITIVPRNHQYFIC